MSTTVTRSDGVVVSTLGNGGVAYDLVTETLHHLNASATAILLACDGEATDGEIVDALTKQTQADPARVSVDVADALDVFRGLGLVDRRELLLVPVPREGSQLSGRGDHPVGEVVAVLNRALGVRGQQASHGVLDTLGLPRPEEEPRAGSDPMIVLDLLEEEDGSFVLIGDRTWRMRSLEDVSEQIGGIVNGYAAHDHTCVTLHSGGVRTPDGALVLLPASSGSGKSTLTAALVAAGCDLVGDEIVGIDLHTAEVIGYPRTISLDDESRETLALKPLVSPTQDTDARELRIDVERLSGGVAPAAAIVFPTVEPGATRALTRLSLTEAFKALLANTLNLVRVGQSGLDVLCHLAETTPCFRLVHPDARSAAAWLPGALDEKVQTGHPTLL